MEITDIKKEIIQLIHSCMNKELTPGTLVETNEIYKNVKITEMKIFAGYNAIGGHYVKDLDNFDFYNSDYEIGKNSYRIIGYYDIMAVLKYIKLKGLEICFIDEGILVYGTKSGHDDYGIIPFKPLHLYTEEEDKNLLDLLIKIK